MHPEYSITREEMKQEAIYRMMLLNIYPLTILQFACDDLVSISEPPDGAFYWTNADETEEMHEWERKSNCLVYVIIRTFSSIGTMDSYLYVSPNKQEWETERALLKRGETFAYVINRDVPWCSEVGWIAFKSSSGAGLIRTA